MMTTKCPQIDDMELIPTMKTCAMLGICRQTLANYVRDGKITPEEDATGRKVYSGRSIKKLFITKKQEFPVSQRIPLKLY